MDGYFYVDSPKGDTVPCLAGPVVHAVKVCQSETLWRIESSSGAYGIASGAERKKRDDTKGVFGKNMWKIYTILFRRQCILDSRL